MRHIWPMFNKYYRWRLDFGTCRYLDVKKRFLQLILNVFKEAFNQVRGIRPFRITYRRFSWCYNIDKDKTRITLQYQQINFMGLFQFFWITILKLSSLSFIPYIEIDGVKFPRFFSNRDMQVNAGGEFKTD